MNRNKVIVGVDIGSTKVATLIGQVNTDPNTFESTINIMGASANASAGVKKGQIVDIEAAVEATTTAVEAAERMAGYNVSRALVAVGGAHISSLNSGGVVAIADTKGEVGDSDVTRVIEAARAISLPTSREIIHVVPREFVVDGEAGVADPVGMSGVRLEVNTHIITASSAALKNLGKTVTEVGVEPTEMVFAGLASAESTVTPTEKELGCVLIDIGGGTTSVAAYVDRALAYSGTIPIGARNVTSDLAVGLRVSLEVAEGVKLMLSAKPKDKVEDVVDLGQMGAEEPKKISRKTLIEGIIKPRLNEIFTMVRLDLEKAGLANRIPAGAIICGGGAQSVGVVEAGRVMLAMPVRVGVPGGVTGLVDDILNPSFATAIGLILYGAREEVAEGAGRGGKKVKLPGLGVFGKIVDTVRDLLP